MRRTIVAALATICVLTGVSTAQATPWGKWKDNYIQVHNIHLPQMEENLTPATLQAAQDRAHRLHVIWTRYVAAQKAWSLAHQPQPVVVVQHSSAPPVHYGGSLQSMVCSFNWSCSIASCVVNRESGWNPRATNPYSGAAGLFQLIPSHWRGKFDPYNPYANASYAYHDLYLPHHSWGAWGGGQYSCGF